MTTVIVIIVLGNSKKDVRLKRTEAAIKYYRLTENPRILFSGTPEETGHMKEEALKQEIPEHYIMCETNSKNTVQNLQNSYAMLLALFSNFKIVVCTSTFHIARAALISSRVFGNHLVSYTHTNESITAAEFASEGRITAAYIWNVCGITDI